MLPAPEPAVVTPMAVPVPVPAPAPVDDVPQPAPAPPPASTPAPTPASSMPALIESDVEIEQATVLGVTGNRLVVRHADSRLRRYVVPWDFVFALPDGERTVEHLQAGDRITRLRIRTYSEEPVSDAEASRILEQALVGAAAGSRDASGRSGNSLARFETIPIPSR